MNHFDKLTTQTRIYLGLVIALENVILLGWIVVAFYLELSPFVILPAALAIIITGCVVLALVATHKVLSPLRTVWQAVLHLSPSEHGEAAPSLERVRYGRELLVNLINQIYQFTTVASEQNNAAWAEQTSIEKDFAATNLPLPLFVLDAREHIVFANPAATAYLQRSADELLGNSFYTMLDLAFPNEQTFDSWLSDAKQNKVTDVHSWERVRLGLPGGQPSPQFDMAAYYNKDNSHGYETMVALFDHTESYSQDDQAVSFIALAVHELRTPLTLLRGYIETFQDEFAGKLDDELDSFMHRMAASGEQLAAFVNNILNVARVEDDQLTLELHEETMKEVIATTVDNYRLRAEVRGIKLDCYVEDDLPTGAVDRVSVYEVVGNLIDNAIKYCGDSKTITITCGMNSAGLIETSVHDEGVGIPINVIPNLFTKFYRNHRNRAQIGGTGLGLYLCKALVKAHGGDIWVKSEEGRGSTFSFTVLPYSRLAEEQKASNNKDITRSAHGWIKNHSMYRN